MRDANSLILCADDFGLHQGVSQGILQLVALGRLSAVGCMVNMPDFKNQAQALLAHQAEVQIGLHFNLTEGPLLSKPGAASYPLKSLLIQSQLRLLNRVELGQELQAQVRRFQEVMGFLPDFIDGHQHVHQLPVVRTALLDYLQKQPSAIFVRSTFPSFILPAYRFKSWILAATGGKAFCKQLQSLRISHNDYFAGVYDFAANSNYRALFRQWLAALKPNSLIMCHPGLVTTEADPIAAARAVELDYFLSDDFVSDCREFQVGLSTGPITRHNEVVSGNYA